MKLRAYRWRYYLGTIVAFWAGWDGKYPIGFKNSPGKYYVRSLDNLLALKEVVLDGDYVSDGVKITEKDRVVLDIGGGVGDFAVNSGLTHPKTIIYTFEANENEYRVLKKNIELNRLSNVKPSLVRISSIKEMFEKSGAAEIDFVKMDCEGDEYNILLNSDKKYLKKIKKVAMEYHESGNRSVDQLVNIFKDAGFRVKTKPNREVPGIGFLFAVRERA